MYTIQVKFPKAKIRLVGEDGNAFSIMGRTIRALRSVGATEEDIDAYQKEATSGDYDNLLRTTMQWVTCDAGREYDEDGIDIEDEDNAEQYILVPAGEYWLGDPCYSVRDEDWIPWLEAADYTNERVLWAQIPGTEYWALGLSTQWGDGCYLDEQGNEYGVDAGLIGLVPVAYNPTTNYTLDENGRNEHGATGIARRVVFDKATRCYIDTRGTAFRGGRYHTLTFGSIRIETGDGDPEECDGCGYEIECCECCGFCANGPYDCTCDDEDDE